MNNHNLIMDVKALHHWYWSKNTSQENGFYFTYDCIDHLLCDVLTPSEKARAKRCIKNGGFFTFGDRGLHCCNSLKAINVYRFFLKVFDVDFTA